MARKSSAPKWIAAGVLAVAVATTTLVSFSASGLRVESNGVKMLMKASVDQGLILKFAVAR